MEAEKEKAQAQKDDWEEMQTLNQPMEIND